MAITLDKERSALLVVDVQSDFLPGGALPVGGGDEIVSPIADLMEAGLFELIVAAQDWHPPEHVSFASNHPAGEPLKGSNCTAMSKSFGPITACKGQQAPTCTLGCHGRERLRSLERRPTRRSIRIARFATIGIQKAIGRRPDWQGT